ncbi:hypothetical protein HF325_001617 [Metschnikowia pulcherrima]|uniref:Uncharacterized protein n=1 Tax=Metschnikowia pulcherrima TaxID=27326 RepID=A0A8H7LD88_9ASCO|nr:hypothetical protein HF325_001617 [Metschnikowia pulcherrima]
MEDSTDFEILDLENVADCNAEEEQSSDTETSTVCDTTDLQESEMYHGVMVKPLSSFGEFEIDPKSQDWQWACDRTSGKVHKDMKTVSTLYNQNLNLPPAALEFIKQSPKLQEEARWEELKAVFYGIYPKRAHSRVFAKLANVSILEALRIVCNKTSSFAHEAILKPINNVACNEYLAKSINCAIETMRSVAESAIQPAEEALDLAQKALDGYNTYTFDESLISEGSQVGYSPLWNSAIENLQLHKRRYIEARAFAFQLEDATARYEKRTQWIHIKASPIFPSDEVDLLFAQLNRLSKLDDTPFENTCEEIQSAYSQQMEIFKAGLHRFGTGPFRELDSLHNSERFQAYDFWVPYQRSSPQMCTTLFRNTFVEAPPDSSYFFVSTPDVLGFPKLHHKIRVYIDVLEAGKPEEEYGSEISFFSVFEPYEFCLNCFESGHGKSLCRKLKRGYGVIIQK